jgi:hypothetical protein
MKRVSLLLPWLLLTIAFAIQANFVILPKQFAMTPGHHRLTILVNNQPKRWPVAGLHHH